MHPDSNLHNPDPAYLRGLITMAGLSQQEAARRIGISPRILRQYLACREARTALDAPYPIQYCLEQLSNITASTPAGSTCATLTPEPLPE